MYDKSAKNRYLCRVNRSNFDLMGKILRFLCVFSAVWISISGASAQQVAWSTSVEPLGGDRYRVVLDAAIPEQIGRAHV